jgi:hypothetical protein
MAQPGFRIILGGDGADIYTTGHEVEEGETVWTKKGDWLWCLHCNRTYQAGDYSLDPTERPLKIKGDLFSPMQYCPLPDCGGDACSDAMRWEDIREQVKEKNWPEIPESNVIYDPYA